MILGRVIGEILGTIKHKFYEGKRMLVVEKPNGDYLIEAAGIRTCLVDVGIKSNAKDVDAEKAKVIEKETALANERKTHVKTALDLAITAGCMPLADRPKWETEFANSHDATLTKLLALKPTIKTSSGVARRDTRTGATSDKREDFMANVRKLQSDGLDYNTAFNRTLKTHGQLLETAAAA